jgi:hypothetical protein
LQLRKSTYSVSKASSRAANGIFLVGLSSETNAPFVSNGPHWRKNDGVQSLSEQ